jgi:hypothetical protein
MTATAERYHCEIGRIRFKHHRDRLPRKDKRAIERAFRNTTAKLKAEAEAEAARQAQIAQMGRQG